ncbi:MAG: DUF4178 domain-containing protein [Armatimonadetes bacterium]|nr:DUF4178 domain-containing protein [Armatimonadota bacterium]
MLKATSLICPSCKGPVGVSNSFVKMVVCDNCRNALAVRNVSGPAPAARPVAPGTALSQSFLLDPTGKTAALALYPTRFGIGIGGFLKERAFTVLGRVRFEGEDGYWDEWYLEFGDGSIGWLEEEEGELMLSRRERLTAPVPDFEAVRVGMTFTVNGQPFFVTERSRTRVAGAEGQLYYRAQIGQEARFLDGNIAGRVAFLEYTEDGIEFSVGDVVEREGIRIRN